MGRGRRLRFGKFRGGIATASRGQFRAVWRLVIASHVAALCRCWKRPEGSMPRRKQGNWPIGTACLVLGGGLPVVTGAVPQHARFRGRSGPAALT